MKIKLSTIRSVIAAVDVAIDAAVATRDVIDAVKAKRAASAAANASTFPTASTTLELRPQTFLRPRR